MQIFLSRDFRAMNAYVRAKRMLMLETAQEFFCQKREKELKERREAEEQQQLRWERLQLGILLLPLQHPFIVFFSSSSPLITLKI